MAGTRATQTGMTLIEMLIALAIGAIVLAALNSVASLGLQAQAAGRQRNELVFQTRFALERMVTTARGAQPNLALALPAVGTTGDWFAPAMYCCNSACNGGVSSSQLIETTTTNYGANGCTGTVIASNVNYFSAQLPLVASGAGPLDDPVAALVVTLVNAAGTQRMTLSTSVRLGGGTL